VWFKHDLRMDDHPGLMDAAAAAPLVPCYCFDERLYGPLLRTPLGFEGACRLPCTRLDIYCLLRCIGDSVYSVVQLSQQAHVLHAAIYRGGCVKY